MTNREKMIEYIIQEAKSKGDLSLKKMFWNYVRCDICPFKKKCCESAELNCGDFIDTIKMEEEENEEVHI